MRAWQTAWGEVPGFLFCFDQLSLTRSKKTHEVNSLANRVGLNNVTGKLQGKNVVCTVSSYAKLDNFLLGEIC